MRIKCVDKKAYDKGIVRLDRIYESYISKTLMSMVFIGDDGKEYPVKPYSFIKARKNESNPD